MIVKLWETAAVTVLLKFLCLNLLCSIRCKSNAKHFFVPKTQPEISLLELYVSSLSFLSQTFSFLKPQSFPSGPFTHEIFFVCRNEWLQNLVINKLMFNMTRKKGATHLTLSIHIKRRLRTNYLKSTCEVSGITKGYFFSSVFL